MKEKISLVKKVLDKEMDYKEINFTILNIYLNKYLNKKYKDILYIPEGVFLYMKIENKSLSEFRWSVCYFYYKKDIISKIQKNQEMIQIFINLTDKRFVLIPCMIYSTIDDSVNYNIILYDKKKNRLEYYINDLKILAITRNFIQDYFRKFFINDKIRIITYLIDSGYPILWFLDYRLRNKDINVYKLNRKLFKVKDLEELFIAYSQFISKMAQNYRIVYDKKQRCKIGIEEKNSNDYYWYKKLLNKFNSFVYGITKKSI